jgi:predicted glycosyltransferase
MQLPQARFDELLTHAAREHGVIVERSRADFGTLLQNCCVSVSQAGYNTLMEILDRRARAVVVPFAGGDETEQTMRAKALAASGRIEVVEEQGLSPETLASAIDRALSAPKPPPSAIDLDGARKSAQLLAAWMDRTAA